MLLIILLRFIDAEVYIPWPVNRTFNGKARRVDSWFGPRDVEGRPEASKEHKGLDINLGGGYDDYGAPVFATHQGTVLEVKDDTKGSAGRRIIIQSPDGSFQTRYLHLMSISVKPGDEIKEGQEIGTIGASAWDSETGTDSHLHYEIKKKDDNGVLVWYDPTEGRGKSEENIVDPQKWIDGNGNEEEGSPANNRDPAQAAFNNMVNSTSAAETLMWAEMLSEILENE